MYNTFAKYTETSGVRGVGGGVPRNEKNERIKGRKEGEREKRQKKEEEKKEEKRRKERENRGKGKRKKIE